MTDPTTPDQETLKTRPDGYGNLHAEDCTFEDVVYDPTAPRAERRFPGCNCGTWPSLKLAGRENAR